MVSQIGSFPNPLELCSDHFPANLASQGVHNKDHTVWLDGPRPPPFSITTSFTNLVPIKMLTISIIMSIYPYYLT
jgi:hypothetical protein